VTAKTPGLYREMHRKKVLAGVTEAPSFEM